MKKEQQIYVVIGLGLVLFVFIYFNFLLGPINKSIVTKKKKIDELNQTIASAKKLASEIDFLREKSKLLELEVDDLQKKLPRSKDIPDLLRRITRNAQKFGLKISNLTPQSIVNQSEYAELPFSVNMTSSFHYLGNFFAEIGQEERLLAVRDLNLNAQKAESISVNGSFTIVAYMAKGSM